MTNNTKPRKAFSWKGFLPGLLFGLAVAIAAPAQAFHFPWDQGHDTTDWNDPDDPGPCEGPHCDPCSSTGSPVYVPTGHFVWAEEDVVMPGRPGLSLRRSYNSHDPRDGIFGRGWSSSCDTGFFEAVGSVVGDDGQPQRSRLAVLRTSDGKRYRYSGGSGVLVPPPGVFEVVEQSGDGGFVITELDGSVRTYDQRGLLLRHAAPSGQAIEYSYNGDGQLEQMMDAAGRTLSFAYNSRGRVDAVTDNIGRVWRYAYDADGNLVSTTDPAGGIRHYQYRQYSPAGDGHVYSQLTRIVDGEGVVIVDVAYNGNRVASYSDGQNRYTYSYNTSTRTVTKTDLTGSRWVYVYNEGGQIVSDQDPLAGLDRHEYDANGKRTRRIDQLGREWLWTYDELGRMLTATNPAGETTTWAYTGDNPRPSEMRSPSGRVTAFTYDDQGNLTSLTDPSGATTAFTWSADGNIRAIRNPLGHVTQITTDATGLPLTITDGLGRNSIISYDGAGRVTAMTDASGKTTRFELDPMGRTTAVVEPSGRRTAYTYDTAGRLLSVIDPAGNGTRFEYDGYGRVSARIMSDGRRHEYRYRVDNLVSEQVRPDGRIEQYAYDTAKRQVGLSVGGESVAYSYNARHELTSATNSTGTVTMSYDVVGRLLTEAVNGQTITYSYNADGERIGLDAFGQTWSYDRDARGLLTGIGAPEGAYGLTYDAAGRRTRLVYPNGVTADYGYDAAGQLTSLAYSGPYTGAYNYSYRSDGLIDQVSSSQRSWSYGYDDDRRLTSASDGSQMFGYQYDAAGNILGEGRVYDEANRLVEDATHTYGYDAAGNLTLKTERATGARTVYHWNVWNQLARVERFDDAAATVPSSTTTFSYGPLERRWRRDVDGVTEQFSYAQLDRLGVLDGNGELLQQATFGPNLDEPLYLSATAGAYHLHADLLSSVVAASDTSGTAAQYDYSPYGRTLNIPAPIGNPFRFTAREYEADDLYYYRARYYDPQLRRFISEDPIGLASGQTNLYAYVGGSPVNATDPTGELAWFVAPIIGGLIGGGIDLAAQLISNGGNWSCVDWGDVGVSAGIGAGLSMLGPSGVIFGRAGSQAAARGYQGGLLNRGNFRIGWSWHRGRNWFGVHGGVPRTPGHWHRTPIPGPAGHGVGEFGVGGGLIGGGVGAATGGGQDCECR